MDKVRRFRTVNDLKKALTDRAGFIKGLIKAGYVDVVVNNATKDDNELIRLALNIYNDIDGTFDVNEFESWVY